jgi:hypothetical protein
MDIQRTPPQSDHCILCGAVPPPPLTGEHIWPDWYSRLHPERSYELESIFGVDGDPSYRPADSLDLKPEVLCEPCNTKWGSTFENRTRPDIKPMSDGETHVVSLLSARRLAAWLCLKAMVAEYLADDPNFTWTFFQQDERVHLRQRAHPPECVKAVWMALLRWARNGQSGSTR